MRTDDLPPTGTCDLTTAGRRSGEPRRIEIWYVIVDGQVMITGTPGARDWLANLRADPHATLHLRDPARDVAVAAHEIVGDADRRRAVEEVWRVQPWYAQQPYSLDDWVDGAPLVVLTGSGGEQEDEQAQRRTR